MLSLASALEPRSIALIGATDRPGSVGAALLANLSVGFPGALDLVNPRRAVIAGRRAFASVADLPEAPDLAIIAAPTASVLSCIAELAARGCKTAVLVNDFTRATAAPSIEDLRRACGAMRLIGPGSLGLASPWVGVHATISSLRAGKGGLAFVGESGTAAGPIVDWANARGIGVAHVVALGAQADVDYADVLDFFAQSRRAEAVLIHLERLRDARRFMSAARALARTKPVIVMKSIAEDEPPARAAIWDAALRRAGLVRVQTLDETFDAIEALLARMPADRRPASVGDRLAIVANGAAIAALACDSARSASVKLATLSPDTERALAAITGRPVPVRVSADANPVDLAPDADAGRYERALELVFDDPGVDAVLVLHGPTGIADSAEIARTVAKSVAQRRATPGRAMPWVFASWPGGTLAQAAAETFDAAHLAHFRTPSDAVRAYGLLVRRRRTEIALTQTPRSSPRAMNVDAASARAAITACLAEGRTALDTEDCADILRAYNIRLEPSDPASSRAITLRLTAQIDADFGPVLRVKLGDETGRRIDPGVAALPPLTSTLAEQALEAGLVGRLLRDSDGGRAAAALLLQQCAQLVADHAEIVGLELDPVIVSHGEAHIRAARLKLAASTLAHPAERLAIRPYPNELERPLQDRTGRSYLLRPITPEDEPAIVNLIERLDPEHLRLRFFQPLSSVGHDFAARLTQLDYDREMALGLAEPDSLPGESPIYGVVRLVRSRDGDTGEYAVTVDSSLQRRGLGVLMMRAMLEYAREIGLKEIDGFVLSENRAMLALNREMGFSAQLEPDDPGVIRVRLAVPQAASAA